MLGFVFLMQTACADNYYSKTFPLDFDLNKQVQNFEFELNVKRNMHIICLSYLGGYDYYQKAAESIKIDYKKEMEKLLNEKH